MIVNPWWWLFLRIRSFLGKVRRIVITRQRFFFSFFFFSFFEIGRCARISLFRPRSVPSGSASWDDESWPTHKCINYTVTYVLGSWLTQKYISYIENFASDTFAYRWIGKDRMETWPSTDGTGFGIDKLRVQIPVCATTLPTCRLICLGMMDSVSSRRVRRSQDRSSVCACAR